MKTSGTHKNTLGINLKDAFYLFGDITAYNAAECCRHLSSGQNPAIVICTSGGSGESALAIVDMIRLIGEVTVFGMGYVESSGLPIYLSAKHRYAGENCIFMYHVPKIDKPGFGRKLKLYNESMVNIFRSVGLPVPKQNRFWSASEFEDKGLLEVL